MDVGETLRLLGKRIRDLREARDWSQEDLARRCGRHFTYIGRIERGEQNVTVEVLFEVARALDTSLDVLLAVSQPSLLKEWNVTAGDVVEAVSLGFRTQVDVKGKLAELMLLRDFARLRELEAVRRVDKDGQPDFVVTFSGREFRVECKNVRSPEGRSKAGVTPRVELQKTRNSKDRKPTRGYTTDHFDVLSVCMFNCTKKWEFRHIAARHLDTRPDDASRLKVMQAVPVTPVGSWRARIVDALQDATR